MTSYTDKGAKPEAGKFLAIDSVTYWVGNAKQAASFYCTRFGFQPLAYKGLETGSRKLASHVVRQNDITFVFESAYEPDNQAMAEYLSRHGDSVRDISFRVEDIDSIIRIAIKRGASLVKDIWEERDEFGLVKMATLQTFGDTVHTFVDRTKYTGKFRPGYVDARPDPITEFLPVVGLDFIDHYAGNQSEHQMESVAKWFEQCLQFHRFFSADDSQLHLQYSAFRSVVMTDYEEKVKIAIIEPAPGKKRSAIEEYVEYNNGPGIQHVALNTSDIVSTVKNLMTRGIEFQHVPDSYYDMLRERLKFSEIKILEDISILQRFKILIDYEDKNGYLLQIFTKNVQDRPTVFVEIIQRRNYNGFGVGNIKALFEAVEIEQAKRGNL